MREFVVTRETAASPERVWSIVTAIEQAPSVISGITSVERLDEGTGFGVGTRWREVRRMFGKQATEEMVVTEVDAGRSYVTEARSHGARYRTVVSVEPSSAGGSRIAITFGAEPERAVARVVAATLGRLFERATRTALERDAADIARAAEAAP